MKTFPFILLLLVALGCVNGPQNTAKSSQSVTRFGTRRSANGARLLIQSEPRNKTGIYQSDFKVTQPIIVKGKEVGGRHGIELNNMASFEGQEPKCVESTLVINLLHGIPTKSQWHFPPNAKLVYVIDGTEYTPIKVIQQDLDKEDSQYWEALITQPTCEVIQKLASANSVIFRVGDATIELADADKSAISEFASATGY